MVISFFLLGAVIASAYSFFLALPARENVFKSQIETLKQKVSQLEKELNLTKDDLKASREELAKLSAEATESEKTESETSEDKASSTRVTKQIGIISRAYTVGRKRYIKIDYIQWFTGEAAVIAAREDGYITPDETSVPNDIYIRNVSSRIRTLEVSSSAVIKIIKTSEDIPNTRKVSWSEFTRSIGPSLSPPTRLCWVYLNSRNIVTRIEEQYTP